MITLIHNLFIDVSQNNYTLMLDKQKQDKNGKAVYETIGYYSTLDGAVNGAKNYCIREKFESDVFTLSEAIQVIRRMSKEFLELLERAQNNG